MSLINFLTKNHRNQVGFQNSPNEIRDIMLTHELLKHEEEFVKPGKVLLRFFAKWL